MVTLNLKPSLNISVFFKSPHLKSEVQTGRQIEKAMKTNTYNNILKNATHSKPG